MSDNSIGKIDCGLCGEAADLRQRQKGAWLYYKCGNCGNATNPSSGSNQQLLWDKARFDSEKTIHRPTGVVDNAKKPELKPEKAEINDEKGLVNTKVDSDFDPNEEPEEQSEKPETNPSTGGLNKGVLAAFVVGVAAVAGAFL